MAELSAIPFSALPQADDGYTVLYENNQVCRSEKKLSELVGDKTSSFLTKEQGDSLYQEKGDYLVDDDITGKLDKSQYAVDSATFLTAHQDISNKLDTTAFSTVSSNFLTAHQSLDGYATQEWVNNQGFLKEHQTISANEWNDVYETVVTNSGTWGTETNWTDNINAASANALSEAKEWVEKQNYITGGDYVPLSATDCKIGSKNTASYNSLAQGNSNSAVSQSFAQGLNNSSNGDALAQGILCYALNESIAQGENNSATNYSFAQGKNNSANDYGFAAGTGNSATTTAAALGQNCSSYYWSIANGDQCTATYRSLAQGERTYADMYSLSQGFRTSAETYSLSQGDTCYATQYSFAHGYNCSSYGYESFAQGMKCVATGSYSFAQGYYTTAKSYSQAMGNNLLIQSTAMAIGEYNKTTNSASESAAFVIGNGTSNNNRSDAFVVYKDGLASATKVATSGIADLEAKIKELENIISSYSASW